MPVRVGINGFGRTGRALLRAARRPEIGLEVVAVNDLGPPEALVRLLARELGVRAARGPGDARWGGHGRGRRAGPIAGGAGGQSASVG